MRGCWPARKTVPTDAAAQYSALCGTVLDAVPGLSAAEVSVELRIHGTPVVTLPRPNMMCSSVFKGSESLIPFKGAESTNRPP